MTLAKMLGLDKFEVLRRALNHYYGLYERELKAYDWLRCREADATTFPTGAGSSWTRSMPNVPVIVDSGQLYALFDRDHVFNHRVRSWFAQNKRPLVTNAAVITGVTHLLGRWCGVDHQLLLLEFLRQPGWRLEHLEGDLARIQALMDRYRDLPANFTDASLVALAERLRCTEVVTTDRR